jgi:hypothetical protein
MSTGRGIVSNGLLILSAAPIPLPQIPLPEVRFRTESDESNRSTSPVLGRRIARQFAKHSIEVGE